MPIDPQAPAVLDESLTRMQAILDNVVDGVITALGRTM